MVLKVINPLAFAAEAVICIYSGGAFVPATAYVFSGGAFRPAAVRINN